MSSKDFYRAVTPYEEELERKLQRAIDIAAHRHERLERALPVLEAARLTAKVYGINPVCSCAPCSVARAIREYDREPA